MKRLIRVIVLVAFSTFLLLVGEYAVVCLKKQRAIDEFYTLKDYQKYLFLGSSQMGCGIEESREFENKVMWTAAAPVQTSLFQLKELERRRQLSHVKVVCVSLNCRGISDAADEERVAASHLRHLPISLRYMDSLRGGILELLWTGIKTAHFPFASISSCEAPPTPRLPLTRIRPPTQVESLRSDIPNMAKNWDIKPEKFALAEAEILDSLREFQVVCMRNHLMPIVVQMPELPGYVENLPPKSLAFFRSLQDKIAAMGIDVWIPKGSYGLDAFVEELHQTEESAHRLTAEIHAYLADL